MFKVEALTREWMSCCYGRPDRATLWRNVEDWNFRLCKQLNATANRFLSQPSRSLDDNHVDSHADDGCSTQEISYLI